MKSVLVFILASILLQGCGIDRKFKSWVDDVRGIQDQFKIDLSKSNFRVIVVDAPFALKEISEANIKITKIEAKESDGSYKLAFTGEKALNLVILRNGKFSIVSDSELPSGEFTELKLYISEASVKLSDGRILPVTLPVGVTSGVSVKLDQPVKVEAKTKTDIIVDIDLSRSFLPKGNTSDVSLVTGFDFFPVMRAISHKGTGQVGGKIVDETKSPVDGAVVEIKNETMSSTTVTNPDGTFLIVGLPLGDYEISLSSEGHVARKDLPFKVEKADVNIFASYLIRTASP